MIKKILTLAFVAQALTVANVWAEDKVTTYDLKPKTQVLSLLPIAA